jgi:hypothetical protein
MVTRASAAEIKKKRQIGADLRCRDPASAGPATALKTALRQSRRDREAAGGAIDPAPRRFEDDVQGRVRAVMGVRTRGLDMRAGFKRDAADRAARADAKAVVDRWNEQLTAGREMLWSPTIRAAMLADTNMQD